MVGPGGDARDSAGETRSVCGLYGRLPELFSVGPLAAVAGEMVLGAGESVAILCTGFDGVVSGINIGAEPQGR